MLSDVVPKDVNDVAEVVDRERLFRFVLDPVPTAAVFDCDGTLWPVDAGSGFMRWSIETGLVSREMADWIDGRYRSYLRGEVAEEAICGDMVRLYQGLREEELRRAAHVFVTQQIEPTIFAEMRELIRQLRALGTEIWAVSSTAQWVIEEAVRPFGIDPQRVLAARVCVRDGVLGNTLEAVPTDDGKVTALRGAGVEHPDVVCGNSVHDAAMLAMAARPVAINPTAALREEAARQGWRLYQPRGREIGSSRSV